MSQVIEDLERDAETAQRKIEKRDRRIAQLEEAVKRGSPSDITNTPRGKLTAEEKDALNEYKKAVQAYAHREIETAQKKANDDCDKMAARRMPPSSRCCFRLPGKAHPSVCEQV